MKEFKVVVLGENMYDVEVQSCGAWLFKWTDLYGKPQEYQYSADAVNIHVNKGNWKVVAEDKPEQPTPNYAAAFNMWQDDFINNPQAYEDSQTVAIRHLTEKLNGEEPSYGQIAAQMLIEYLNKTESK